MGAGPLAEQRAIAIPGYVVGDQLGAGGFGEVFRARHALIDREVAIKVLHEKYSADPDAVARFIAEARAVNKISHPGIVEIFDFGTLTDGRQYCVMELLHGRTLRDLLRERGRLPVTEALPILRAIADAVDAAHAAGVAHRDLKPDNVFVLDRGGVKLIDFGLAKLTREDAPAITQTGSVFGTPLYMSPEQCRGKAITSATDAYSFGIVVYQILVGEPPFSGDALELALHHLNDAPPVPSRAAPELGELGERVDRVVLALLAKEPAQRPESLVAAIEAISEGVLPPRPRAPRRTRGLIVGLALAMAAAGVGGLVTRGCAAPATDDGCVPAIDRITGIWDPATRAKISARFAAVHRPEVDAAWRLQSGELDAYTNQWSTQWTAACRAPDRAKDPLLYGQRLACLEHALLAMRGVTESAAEAEVIPYAEGFLGYSMLPVLDDCLSTPVLRAQSPAPPAELADEVGRLVSDVERGRADLRTANNANRPALIRVGLARLDKAAARLDELGVPEAAIAWYWRAHMLVALTPDDSRPAIDGVQREERVEQARRAVEMAVRRATELRNDQWLARAYLRQLDLDRKLGDRAKADATLARAEAAVERAGRPGHASAELLDVQIQLALGRHEVARARTDIAAWWKLVEHRIQNVVLPRRHLEMRLDLAREEGKLDEVAALAREILEIASATWGPDHRRTVTARIEFMVPALQAKGDHQGALEQLQQILASDERVGASAGEIAEVRSKLVPLAWHLGQRPYAEEELRKIPPGEVRGWLVLIDAAFQRGELELASRAIERATSGNTRELDAWSAYLAFTHGDTGGIRAPAERALGSNPEDVLALILLVYVEAVENGPQLATYLTRLKRFEDSSDPGTRVGAMWGKAIAALAGGRAADAVASLRKGIEVGDATFGTWDRAEYEAFLGVALVEARDPKMAIAPLEHSLALLHECCDDFHYFAPMAQLALARALADTGGDLARARTLAAQARDGFARIGTHRERERQAAIRWLAQHD